MYNQKNVLHMFIGKAVTVLGDDATIVEGYASLIDGTVAFLNDSNLAVSDISALDYFRVAVRNGTSLLLSPRIKRTTITNARTINTVSQTQQVTYLGYNGVTGQFTPINTTAFTVNIEKKYTSSVC